MSGLPIPDDWNEPADGYCDLSLTIPNSPRWKAHVKGALYGLWKASWDSDTGDPTQAAQVGKAIFESLLFNCPQSSPVQIFVDVGNITQSGNNIWAIDAVEYWPGEWYIKVFVNHNGLDYVDANTYQVSVTPENYISDPGEEFYVYNRSDALIEMRTDLDLYCDPNFGWFDMWSYVQTFSAILTVGDVCP